MASKLESMKTRQDKETVNEHSPGDISEVVSESSESNAAKKTSFGIFEFSNCSSSKRTHSSTNEYSEVMLSHDVDFHQCSEDYLVELALEAFRYYDLFDGKKTREETVYKLVRAVSARYVEDNAFHNFRHAMDVMHTSFQILINGADQLLTQEDIFAILIASICHDIDHRGRSNSFEKATGCKGLKIPDKKIMEACREYTATESDGILECHHSWHTFDVLKSIFLCKNGTEPNGDEISFLSKVIMIILGTDMEKHNENVSYCEKFSKWKFGEKITLKNGILCTTMDENRCSSIKNLFENDTTLRTLLLRVICHCADIGAQSHNENLAKQWMFKCYEEYKEQATEEKKLGIITAAYLHDLGTHSKMYFSQYIFLRDIVEPLWKNLAVLFPKLSFASNQVTQNKSLYLELSK